MQLFHNHYDSSFELLKICKENLFRQDAEIIILSTILKITRFRKQWIGMCWTDTHNGQSGRQHIINQWRKLSLILNYLLTNCFTQAWHKCFYIYVFIFIEFLFSILFCSLGINVSIFKWLSSPWNKETK